MTSSVAITQTQRLADIADLDFVQVPSNLDLVDALVTMQQAASGAVFFTMPGGDLRFLHKDHCSELLTAALQGYPVPRTLVEAAQPILSMAHDLSVLEALTQLAHQPSKHVAVCRQGQMMGYVGPQQWLSYTETLFLPAAAPAFTQPMVDELTGLPDFRAYRMHLEMSLIDYFDQGIECSLVLLELDWRHGLVQFHSTEDEQKTLQRVTQTMLSSLRDEDQLFALEPGKWGLVIRGQTQHVARSIAQRIKANVWDARFPNHGSPLGAVSVSAGLAGPSSDADAMENDAEEILEQVIMSGGNGVLVMGERLI